MTWEQFLSALLAIGVTVAARLVNQWLPQPVLAHPPGATGNEWATPHANTEPMAGPPSEAPTTPPAALPHSTELPMAQWDDEPTTGSPAPSLGTPPQPPDEPTP